MLVPPGLITAATVARHLGVRGRQFRKLAARTALSSAEPVALGRAMGSFRHVPQLGVMVLRQIRSEAPHRLASWQGALADVLQSASWRRATLALRSDVRNERPPGSAASHVEESLLSPSLGEAMRSLHEQSLATIETHGLGSQVQIEPCIVDRLEDEGEAVVLVGSAGRAFSLSTALLRTANLEREKARGILVATRTGAGVELDVWPAVGEDEPVTWVPDSELLDLRGEAGA